MEAKVQSRLDTITRLMSDLTSGIKQNIQLALGAISITIGFLSLYKASDFLSMLSQDEKMLISDQNKLRGIIEKLGMSETLIKRKKGAKPIVKYMYWSFKEKSPFFQKKPKKCSLSKIEKILEKNNLNELPDPEKHNVWLQNDSKSKPEPNKVVPLADSEDSEIHDVLPMIASCPPKRKQIFRITHNSQVLRRSQILGSRISSIPVRKVTRKNSRIQTKKATLISSPYLPRAGARIPTLHRNNINKLGRFLAGQFSEQGLQDGEFYGVVGSRFMKY